MWRAIDTRFVIAMLRKGCGGLFNTACPRGAEICYVLRHQRSESALSAAITPTARRCQDVQGRGRLRMRQAKRTNRIASTECCSTRNDQDLGPDERRDEGKASQIFQNDVEIPSFSTGKYTTRSNFRTSHWVASRTGVGNAAATPDILDDRG